MLIGYWPRRFFHRAAVNAAPAGRNHHRAAPAELAKRPALGVPQICPARGRFALASILLFYDEDAGGAEPCACRSDRRLPVPASADGGGEVAERPRHRRR